MSTWKRVSLSAAAAVAIVALLLFPAVTAAGDGAGAVSFTQTFHNAVQSLPFPNPCTGAAGSFTITENGVLHVTELTSGPGAGTAWATGTMTGDFVFTPLDPTQPSYCGHATAWFGDNNNLQNGAETAILVIHGVGPAPHGGAVPAVKRTNGSRWSRVLAGEARGGARESRRRSRSSHR